MTMKSSLFCVRSLFTGIVFVAAAGIPLAASAVPIAANFQLFGEVWRANLATATNVEVEVRLDGAVAAQGRISFDVGGAASATSVLAGAVLPPLNTFGVIDVGFTTIFDIDVDAPHDLDVFLRTGGIRAVMDFADGISLPGSILGDSGNQGLTMTGVTLLNGDPLSSQGLGVAFDNTASILEVGVSANGVLHNDSVTLDQGSEVTLFPNSSYPSYASARASGALIELDASSDPNPFVIDFANASFRSGSTTGGGNFQLVNAPTGIPAPGTLSLVALAVFAAVPAAAGRRRKGKVRGSRPGRHR